MQQRFANFLPPKGTATQLVVALQQAGFDAHVGSRQVGEIVSVRVRKDTDDQAEASKVVGNTTSATRLVPSSTPTSHIEGYRDGR